MKIQHKFFEELELLESQQMFCGKKLQKKSKFLVIGTFNPNKESCDRPNLADWFYGRDINWFWRYLPESMGLSSLLQKEGGDIDSWRKFCADNNIVIVDLVKEIDGKEKLPDFKDGRIDNEINDDLKNVNVFNFQKAFKGVKFEKILFTRKGWNPSTNKDIPKLIRIKCRAIESIIENNIVNNLKDIKYCPAPWTKRKSTLEQWKKAIRE